MQSDECEKLKQRIMTKYESSFKERLEPSDRLKVPPVRLFLDPDKEVKPICNTRAFDVQIHLCRGFESELKDCLHAGVLSPATEPSKWASKSFIVANKKPGKVCLMADFRVLNSALARPVWPTESCDQLLNAIAYF